MNNSRDYIAVIGGGPAGLAAALSAVNAGCNRILLIERDRELGGILNQCVHDGFGTLGLGRSLTGPEYAAHYIDEVIKKPEIEIVSNTAVLSLKKNRRIIAVNQSGLLDIKPSAVILAMGCRERSRFQTVIPGFRPAGIFTAGTVQRLINIEGMLPGEKVVVLGSGDIGMIMARRLTLEGAEVRGVFEIAPRPGGLTRNIVQCLYDYNIPLHLSHTVTFIHGKKRIEGVTIAPVDQNLNPLSDKEFDVECDTLVLSVGLIPENELSREAGVELDPLTGGPFVDQHMATSVPGIYAGGNVVHVYDLVDYVTGSADKAGLGAADYIKKKLKKGSARLLPGFNVAHVIPQYLSLPLEQTLEIFLRVKEPAENVKIRLSCREQFIFEKKERIVRPSEMIKVKIPLDFINSIQRNDQITVSVE
ncbi:MAG: FAD-dependent oxidoreductase [Bacillota bacterium]|nr:FAD-dependent oxidoreductase [Bacillota bacterium]